MTRIFDNRPKGISAAGSSGSRHFPCCLTDSHNDTILSSDTNQFILIGAVQTMKRIPDEACASICGLFCGACPSFPEECHGCLSDYVRKGCQNCTDHGFLDCAVRHSVHRCCECRDFPCEKLREFSTRPIINGICNHASVIPGSLRMGEAGISQWLREKIEQHRCPACGELITWFDMGSHICSGREHS